MVFEINKPEDKGRIVAYINDLKADRRYIVNIRIIRNTRTIAQNSLYWMWLNHISAETGNSADALHDYFRERYLPVFHENVFESEKKLLTSTTKLDTKQMSDYMDCIHVEMSGIGIELPMPGQSGFDAFCEFYKDQIWRQ